MRECLNAEVWESLTSNLHFQYIRHIEATFILTTNRTVVTQSESNGSVFTLPSQSDVSEANLHEYIFLYASYASMKTNKTNL